MCSICAVDLTICTLVTFPTLSSSDPATHCHFTQVHLWQTHFGQAREVLHEERIRTGTDRRPHKRPAVIRFTVQVLWRSLWAGAPPPHPPLWKMLNSHRDKLIILGNYQKQTKRQIDFNWDRCENNPCRCGPASGWGVFFPWVKHKPNVNDVIDVFDWFSYYLVH